MLLCKRCLTARSVTIQSDTSTVSALTPTILRLILTPKQAISNVLMFFAVVSGGYGYDSTDMAAVQYRLQTLKCDRVVVITDAGQVRNICGFLLPALTLKLCLCGQRPPRRPASKT